MVVPVLYFYLLLQGLPAHLPLFVIQSLPVAFPVAGSAYTYAYASFGELFAWIIGWALIMEYSIGNIYVAFSWSDYFTSFLHKVNLHIPDYLTLQLCRGTQGCIK
jgi:amino acid transporter